jgi:hypothetical protein
MRRTLAIVALATLAANPANGLVVGGGGGASTECLTVFDAPANYRPENPKHILCTDGDPSCDGDAVVNGVCAFPITVCANAAFDPRCVYFGVQSIAVDHALDNGDPRFDPDFQALQSRIDSQIAPPTTDLDVCTTAPTTIRVPVRGPLGSLCTRGRKKLRLVTTSTPPPASAPRTDKDKMRLVCEPAVSSGGCDPQVLFTGTFDRIQRQVFNQSCAVSGCHDSQALAGGMTLEEGTAHASLVDVPPNNPAAAAAGWKRVATTGPTSGDPAVSFIFHKVTGDLPDAEYGERMPRGRPKLDQLLIDIIELWIEAGAPETGWVPGTD